MEEGVDLQTFQCDVCNLFLKTRLTLKCHKMTHQKAQNFRCRVCFKSFKQKRYLKDHIKRLHNQSKIFLTQVPITPSQSKILKYKKSSDDVPRKSNKISENRKSADMTTMSDKIIDDNAQQKRIECELCCKAFNERKQLRLHNLFSCAERQFQCWKCDMKFPNSRCLNDHFQAHGSLVFICNFENCKADFLSSEYLHEHQRIKGHFVINAIIPQPPVRKICKRERQCSESSISSDDSSDVSSSQSFLCNLCSKTYQTHYSLWRHKKEVHNVLIPSKFNEAQAKEYFSLDRPHACPLCDLRFNNAQTLRDHINRHNAYKFECQACGNKYRRQQILKEHERRAHQSASSCKKPENVERKNFTLSMPKIDADAYFSPDRPFPCTQCDLRFNHSLTLKDHLEKHPNFSFECGTCGNKYRSEEILSAHRRIKNHCEKLETFIQDKITPQNNSQNYNKQNVEGYFSLDREFACILCDLRFNQLRTLQDHIKRHDQYKFECQTCGNKYRRKIILNYHQMKAHGKKINLPKFKCLKCNKIFNGRDNLYQHLKKVHKSGHFQKRTTTSQLSQSVAPIRRQNSIKTLRFRCQFCEMSYLHRSNLTRHLKKMHKNVHQSHYWNVIVQNLFSPTRQLKCNKCDLRFTQHHALRDHLNSHPNFKHKCEIEGCGMDFFHEEILKEHQRRAHEVANGLILNDENSNRKEEIRLKTIGEAKQNRFSLERPFKCFKCDLRFDTSKHRNEHFKRHANFKFKCNINSCGMSYHSSEILSLHQKKAHITPSEQKRSSKKFKCQKCSVAYKYRRNLKIHMRKVHSLVKQPLHWLNVSDLFSMKRPYACNECDVRFNFSSGPAKHKRKHSEFKFKCEVDGCGMRYWHELILKEHQRRAHNISIPEENSSRDALALPARKENKLKKFKCHVCKAGFPLQFILNNHLKKEHKTNQQPFNWHNSIRKLFSQNRPLACDQCDLRFEYGNVLRRHKRGHSGFQNKCDDCGYKYWHADVLKEHRRIFHENIKKVDENVSKVDEEIFKEHPKFAEIQSNESEAIKSTSQTFSCKKCNKAFLTKINLKRHNRLVHERYRKKLLDSGLPFSKIPWLFSTKRNHACHLCDLRFTQRNSLRDHLDSHLRFKFRCDECGFKYWTQEILNEHKRRKHRKNNEVEEAQVHNNETDNIFLKKRKISEYFSLKRPYACNLCDLRFSKENPNLRDHLNSHEHDRFKFECNECGFKYWTQEILNEHKKRAHNNEKDQAEIQKEKTQEKFSRNSPEQQENLTQIRLKQLICHKCDSTFTHRKHLNAHLKEIHDTFDAKWQSEIPKKFSLKKPFACSKCDLRFMKENVLNKHLKGHGNFKFTCNAEGCGNKYRHWEVLREHQKRAHADFLLPCESELAATDFDENEENLSPKEVFNENILHSSEAIIEIEKEMEKIHKGSNEVDDQDVNGKDNQNATKHAFGQEEDVNESTSDDRISQEKISEDLENSNNDIIMEDCQRKNNGCNTVPESSQETLNSEHLSGNHISKDADKIINQDASDENINDREKTQNKIDDQPDASTTVKCIENIKGKIPMDAKKSSNENNLNKEGVKDANIVAEEENIIQDLNDDGIVKDIQQNENSSTKINQNYEKDNEGETSDIHQLTDENINSSSDEYKKFINSSENFKVPQKAHTAKISHSEENSQEKVGEKVELTSDCWSCLVCRATYSNNDELWTHMWESDHL